MELKQLNKGKEPKKESLLIEPLLELKQITPKFLYSDKKSFNRTTFGIETCEKKGSSGRSFSLLIEPLLELKLICYKIISLCIFSFNRTTFGIETLAK